MANVALIEVKVAHPRDASVDQDRCDRREYWLSRPSGDVLVATDCETQWGADNPGPATVKVMGTKVEIRYIEFQSSDSCDVYSATVELSGPTLTAVQMRTSGTTTKNGCHPGTEARTIDALGDGSASRPLLTLHR